MFLYCTSQGVDIVVKWLISLVVTSNHKCLNKIVSNKLALIIFEPRTQPQGGTDKQITTNWTVKSILLQSDGLFNNQR